MLHVTNGDSAAEPLKASGLPGEVSIWADVLHEGPVLPAPDDPAWRTARLAFLAAEGYATLEEAADNYERWDATLQSAADREEVVLWFEHDLFDQLLLVRHLEWFTRKRVPLERLTLICVDRYLGNLEPDDFRVLFPSRQPISTDQVMLARHAWAAFTSPEPGDLEPLAAISHASLPFLPAAVSRLLEEYPAVGDGLARSERQGLEAIRDGAATLGESFGRASAREAAVFMGDASFFARMRALASGPVPLVSLDTSGPLEGLGQRPVALTDAGHGVIAGSADAVHLNGIDRWIGGVHLYGYDAAWRWDRSASRLVASV
jgi:hypothetical protein